MVKASRMPLGYAAKMYIQVGDIDRNGRAATQAGWYYKWYRGLKNRFNVCVVDLPSDGGRKAGIV